MTSLFTNLSKNVLCTVVGPRMDRHYIENGPIHSRQLFAVLVMLLYLGVGQMWGTAYKSYIGNEQQASTTISGSNVSSGSVGVISWTGNSCTYSDKRVNISANGYITFTASSGYNITKIVITSGSSSSYYGTWTSNPSVTPSSSSGVTTFDGLSASSVKVTTSTAFRCTSASDIKIYYAASGPNITTSSLMTTFGCNLTTGVPVKQSFTVSGTALTNNVTVTPPSGYEVCLTENGTYASSVTLNKGSGTLSSTTVYVKLKDDNAAGSYSGNIACTSSGATTKNVAVSGSTPFKVTWKANGSTYATTYVAYASGEGTAIGTLPDDPDAGDYCGDVFYGWYDGASYSHASVAPSIIGTSTKITSDKTYVAVFADEEDGGTTTVYKLVSSLTNAKDYVFVTRNTAGSGYALSSSVTTGTSVTITTSGDDKIVSGTPANTIIWTAATGWNLQNKNTSTYLVINGSSFGLNASAGTLYWSTDYGLYGKSGSGKTSYYVQCSTGTFSKSESSSTTNRVWAYEKTTVSVKTHTNFKTTCCTSLGTINGSVSWSNDGTSLTVKNWGYTQGTGAAESNISKYTVYLYSDADSYAASIDNADCTVANRASTGVTFTGLNYARTYKVKITATPASGYCPVDDVWSSTTYKLTCATPTAATAGSFDRTTQKMPISWTSGAGKVDICYSSNSSTPAATPGSGYTVVSNQTSSPVNLDVSGLAAGNYYCWVRSVCDASNKSSWTAITGSTFTIPSHTLTITKDGGGTSTITPASGSSVVEGRTASITASPATGYAFDHWAVSGTNATLSSTSTNPTTFTMGTANATVTGYFTCVPPVVTADPDDADYYIGDDPEELSVTATLASGTLTYLWKVSTNGGSTWSDAEGTNNEATYSGASLSTASVGTLKFKCIVGNSEGGCNVESGVATITVANASYFPNGKTIFIQAYSTSAWDNSKCVKAWFHTSGGSETAQSTYWLFDATGDDNGKKLFAAVVPASGDLPYLDIQRFESNCNDWKNKNGGCSFADAAGSNIIRSTGSTDTYNAQDDYIRWNGTALTMSLMSSVNWNTSVANVTDQGSGVWKGTYEYTPAATSTDYVIATNYNGNLGNTGVNPNATLSGMIVGSTYNVTATFNIMAHTLVMSKEFVKGEVSFDLQGHGDAISKLTNVTAGSKISAPSEPSATGYTFGGWFTDPECTDEWTFATDEVSETMTLYAKWTANVYTITKTFSNVANAGIPDNFTYTGSTTTALNSSFTVNTTNFFLPSSITVTMGGATLTAGTDYTYNNSTGAFTFDVTVTGNIVITASATAKLKSIAITTQPNTRKYLVGETFSSTGAVVTATMGNGDTKTVDATWTPSGALSAGTGQKVTATYTENGVEKTATTTIDVYSVTVNKVNMNGDAIENANVTASNSVRTLSQSVGSTNHLFNSWEVTAGGVTISTSTITGTPSANVVINAKFHDPITVTWKVGNGAASGGTSEVKYNTKVASLPTPPANNALASCGTGANTFMGWTAAGKLEGTGHSAPADLFTSKDDAGCVALTTNTTYRAVFAHNAGSGIAGYNKITDSKNISNDGRYLIVYEASSTSAIIFDGSLEALDGSADTIMAQISSSFIAASSKLASSEFTIDMTNLYIKSASNKYINYSSNSYGNGLSSLATTGSAALHSISIDGSGNFVVFGSCHDSSDPINYVQLKYNTLSAGSPNYGSRFRFYKHTTGDTEQIQLYKYDSGVSYSDYITGCCSDAELAYSPATETKTFGDAAFTKTLTNTHSVAVTYALSNVSPAGCVTINSTTGQVSIAGAGSATVTASSIAQEVNDISYCADEASYTLTVNKANITPTLSYESETLVIGDDSSNPTIGGNTGSGTVTYAVTTANPAGCVTVDEDGVVTAVAEGTATITATVAATTNYNSATATADFTVTCGAPSSVDISGAFQFYPGETIELTATPTGGAGTPVTYQWKKDGVNIVGATSATYTKNNATVDDAGAYTCTVQYGSNCATTSANFNLKCMQFYLKTSLGADIDHYALTKVDATHATLSLNLTGGTTYNFRITDGCNDWYGNSDETGITSANPSNWTMPHDADAKVTTGTKTATYTFNFDFTAGVLGDQMKVSVVYPSTNQASGKVIYWDNEVNKWDGSKLWYRIGKKTHNTNIQLSKVAGTANFYSVTTSQYDGFDYWHIANNQGQGTGNIYWTKDNSGSGLAITNAMGFEGAPVTEAATTVTPTTTHITGTSEDNNNCEFYTYSITTGIKSYTVASSGTNCTVTMEKYNDDAGTSTTALASGGTVMPTQYIRVTVTPTTGYQFSSVVVTNGTTVTAAAAGTPGVYYITGNATVTATCSVKSCTVNFDKNNGTGGDNSTTATFGSAMTTVTAPTRTGYTFDGYWDGAGGTGTQYYLANGTSARNWDKDVTAAQTLYAKWNAKQYTIELDREGAASGATSVTATFDAGTLAGWSAPSKTGYTFAGYWSADNGTGTMVINASGVLQSSVQISSVDWTDASGNWIKDGGVTVYAKWNANQYKITYKDQGDADYSGSNGALLPGTHTYGTVTNLVDGERSGYRFDGWFENSTCTGDAVTTIGATAKTAAFTLYAKWTQVYTVTWHVGNGTWNVGEHNVTVGNTKVVSGGQIDAMPDAPANNTLNACANTFMGWSKKSAGATAKTASYYDDLFTTQVTSPTISTNTDFYAVFAEEVNSGTYSDGTTHQWQGSNGYQDWGGNATYSWLRNNDTDLPTFEYTPAYDIKKIVLNVKQTQTAGSNTVAVSVGGTAVGSTATVGSESGTNNFDLTFDHGTGTPLSGKVSIVLTNTSGSGTGKGTFYLNSITLYEGDPDKELINYVTLCADDQVRVSYNLNGGYGSACTEGVTTKTASYTVCSTTPTKNFYDFTGWNDGTSSYAAGATGYNLQVNTTFTAQWTPTTYNITYENMEGATNPLVNVDTYDIETATITLGEPTRGHDRFEGWFTDDGVWSNEVTEIPLGSHGDITLYAKWAERHEIVFNADGETTTIYRADDENMEDAVAGQGSVPSDPSAPTACSSKVFVGWSESEIDDETDDEPADLMKPAAGTVNEDKEYYAVWALRSGTPIAAVEDEDNSFTTSGTETYCGMTNGMKQVGDYILKNNIWTSSNMSNVQVKIKVYHLSNNRADVLRISLVNSSGEEVVGTDLTTTAKGSNSSSAAYSSYVTLTPTSTVTGYKVALKTLNSNGTCVDKVTREVVAATSAYSTSCCATKVTLSENSPEHGTIVFGKTSVGTCGGDQNVSLTITPAAGYQLSSYEVATGSGKVAAKSVSPAIALNNNSSAAQNITLTFAEDANGAYDVTASFTEMTVTSWTWTNHDGGAAVTTDPFEIYVGQSARVDVAYNPSSVLSSHKNYSRSKDDTYINWPGGAQPSAYCTFIGKATTGENTTTITLTHSDASLTQLVYVKVLPLPLTHFADLVHGKAFADVAATIVDNALSATKTTPTSDDWTTPNANTCEENHLHLVGWIREDWPALVAYLNGTGAAPTTVAITGAGNDGEGHAYFLAPGASINVQTFDGVTFYAVWGKIE